MRQATYTDRDGRLWATLLPDDAPDSEADLGVPVGPPSLEALGLPLATEVRLHNQLYHRRLLTADDVARHPLDVHAALQAALKVDAQAVAALYQG